MSLSEQQHAATRAIFARVLPASEVQFPSAITPLRYIVSSIISGWQLLALILTLAVFFGLGAYQLHLPGLHYDEAKEAGLNAMQLVSGQPVTAFRDAVVNVGAWQIPLMVQDYIGALNVVLAMPFVALGSLTPADPAHAVVVLRWLPLLTGGLTLVLVWQVARLLGGPLAATGAAALLAVNPAFVFWSRQGIFVTNLTALFFMASLVFALRWWRERRAGDLWMMACCWGLGIYSKLLFTWAIGAMAIVGLVAWYAQRRLPGPGSGSLWQETNLNEKRDTLPGTAIVWLGAGLAFLVPLVPLILFNLRTGGTFISIVGNLGQSYYGVDNSAYLPNLLTRIGQVGALLRGDFFWYIGEIFANPWAPAVSAGLIMLTLLLWAVDRSGFSRAPAVLLPLALLALIVAQSAFTVSDLFITHYVLLLPLIPCAAGIATTDLLHGLWFEPRHGGVLRPAARFGLGAVVLAGTLLWWGGDLWTTVRYHQVLQISGGYAGHSDAIMALAEHTGRGGPSAPLALDWGMDAPLRYLTVGRVNPIEVFGYDSLEVPDAGFAGRIEPFLANEDNVYLAHAPDATIFHGRLEALVSIAQAHGLIVREEAQFRERNGRPLFLVYRVVSPAPE